MGTTTVPTKKGLTFYLGAYHEHHLSMLKNKLTDQSVLAFYDPSVPLTLKVYASIKGLGAALKQNIKPVTFASKALTQTQAGCSNVEREALGLVNGVQRYHHYLNAKHFTTITDYKPLVDIRL